MTWQYRVLTRSNGEAIPNFYGGGSVARLKASVINQIAPDVRRQLQTFAASGTYIPAIWGRNRIGGKLFAIGTISTDLVLGYLIGLGELQEIEATIIDDAAPHIDIDITTYVGAATQTADATLASAISGYADDLVVTLPGGTEVGLAYAVLRIPTTAMSTIPRSVQFVVKGRKCFNPDTELVEYTENPALHLYDLLTSPVFGIGLTVFGVEECAARSDELLGGSDPRHRTGIVLDTPADGLQQAALLADYGEILFPVWEGDAIRLVPDAPVDEEVDAIAQARIVEGTYTAEVADTMDAPTEVEVRYIETTGTATPWQETSAVARLAGVDDGSVPRRQSVVQMPGIHRYSEAYRVALARLRRAQIAGRHRWRTFDRGVLAQLGDVVRVNYAPAKINRMVRITSVRMSEPGRFDVQAQDYDPSAYPDDVVTPGGTTQMPVGGIVPLRAGTIAPAGYALYADANGKLIRCAGGSVAVGSSGGSNTITVSGTTSTDPSHTGAETFNAFVGKFGGSNPVIAASDASAAGVHAHTYSAAANIAPLTANFPLIIKTGSPGLLVPAVAAIFSTANLSHPLLSKLTSNAGRLIGAAAAQGISGSSSQVLSPTSSAAGAHSHQVAMRIDYDAVDFTNGGWETIDVGDHAHVLNLTLTPSAARRGVMLWSGSEDFPLVVGSQILWAGSLDSLPSGWQLCDGTNGTPDFRGLFIEIVTTSAGVLAGNNTVGWAGLTDQRGHNHRGPGPVSQVVEVRQAMHTDDVFHQHSASGATSWTPPYYALALIQYMGE